MLRRFADARLRARLARALRARNDALADARAEKRRRLAADNEVTTLRVLLATWQRIARQAQDDLAKARADLATQIAETQEVATELAAERTRTKETAGRCGDIAPTLSLLASRARQVCCLTAGHAGWHKGDDGSEWSWTEETTR